MAMINDSTLTDALVHPTQSSRIISLGFYDGTTNGLMELAAGVVFRYDLVSWDDHEDRRIYCLARMGAAAFGDVVEILSPLGTPTWPRWLPRWEFSSDQQKTSVERLLDDILDHAEPYSVAALGTDIKAIDHAIVLDGQSYQRAEVFRRTGQIQPFGDWSPFFGIGQ